MQPARKHQPPPPPGKPKEKQKPPPPPPPKKAAEDASYRVYREGYKEEEEKPKLLMQASSALNLLKDNVRKKRAARLRPALSLEGIDTSLSNDRTSAPAPERQNFMGKFSGVGKRLESRLRTKSDHSALNGRARSPDHAEKYEKLDKQTLISLILKRERDCANLLSEKTLLQEETSRLMEQLVSFTQKSESEVSDISYQSHILAVDPFGPSPQPSLTNFQTDSNSSSPRPPSIISVTSVTSNNAISPPHSPKLIHSLSLPTQPAGATSDSQQSSPAQPEKKHPSSKNLKMILKMEHTKRLKNEKLLKEQIIDLETRAEIQSKQLEEAEEELDRTLKKSQSKEKEFSEKLRRFERENNVLKQTSETGTHDIADLNTQIVDLEAHLKKRDRLAADLNLQIQRLKDEHEREKQNILQEKKESPEMQTRNIIAEAQGNLNAKVSDLQEKLVNIESEEEKEEIELNIATCELLLRLYTLPINAEMSAKDIENLIDKQVQPHKDKAKSQKKQIKTLKRSAKEKEATIEELKTALETSKQEIENKEKEKEQLKDEHEQKIANVIETYDEKLKAESAKMKKESAKFFDYRSKTEAQFNVQRKRHNTDIEELKQHHERAITIEQQVISEQSKHKNNLQSEKERVQNLAQQHQKEVERLQTQLKVAGEKCETLDAANYKLKQTLKKYEKRNQKFDAQIKGLQLEIDNLTDLWEASQDKNKEHVEKYEETTAKYRTERSEYRMKINTFNRLLEDERKRNEELDAKTSSKEIRKKKRDKQLHKLAREDLLLVATVSGLQQSLDHGSVRQLEETSPDLSEDERFNLSNKFINELLEGVKNLEEGSIGGRKDVVSEFRESRKQLRDVLSRLLKLNANLILNENELTRLNNELRNSGPGGDQKDSDEHVQLKIDVMKKSNEEKEKRITELEKELAVANLRNLELQ